MRVAIRVDASLDIGTGHVMRCLTLAEALRERGATCVFISRTHPGNLLDAIRARGFPAFSLPVQSGPCEAVRSAYADWLGANWQTDAEQTGAHLADLELHWLIVDHYALDICWERTLRPLCRRLMVIDDLADRPHDCDLLLDQNFGRTAANYAGFVPADCTVLTGPRYALLRPEFAALRPYSLARRDSPQLKHLLITMGGVDKDNATGKVMEALKRCSLPEDCHITVVMGPSAPWLGKILEHACKMPWATEVLVNTRNMARLMADSDLAIGAAGSTSWERCCLGLPTLTMVLAENQREVATALDTAGAVILLDSLEQGAADWQDKLSRLVRPERLQAMQQACISITDGAGVARLAPIMMNINE